MSVRMLQSRNCDHCAKNLKGITFLTQSTVYECRGQSASSPIPLSLSLSVALCLRKVTIAWRDSLPALHPYLHDSPAESSSTRESQSQNHSQTAVCRSPRRQHTAFSTVILALALPSGVALMFCHISPSLPPLSCHPVGCGRRKSSITSLPCSLYGASRSDCRMRVHKKCHTLIERDCHHSSVPSLASPGPTLDEDSILTPVDLSPMPSPRQAASAFI